MMKSEKADADTIEQDRSLEIEVQAKFPSGDLGFSASLSPLLLLGVWLGRWLSEWTPGSETHKTPETQQIWVLSVVCKV